MYRTIIILSLVFLYSCAGETTDPFDPNYKGEPIPTLFEQLYTENADSTLFRGRNLGTYFNYENGGNGPSTTDIEVEEWDMSYKQQSRLLLPDSPDSIDVIVTYACDAGWLYRIEVDLRLANAERSAAIWAELKADLDAHYTASAAESEYAVWMANPTGKKQVEVSLSNYPTEYKEPRLILRFMNPTRAAF